MEWSIHNNTTPWYFLSNNQKAEFRKYFRKGTRISNGLDYGDWSYSKMAGIKYNWTLYLKRWAGIAVGYAAVDCNQFVDYTPNGEPANHHVLRIIDYPKAPPPPEPREFFIVMDHGKLIGYFDDYPVALQHYEIIKVKEQL